MNEIWLQHCNTQKIQVVDKMPSALRFSCVAVLMLKDEKGSVLSYATFDIVNDDLAVTPCQTENTYDTGKIIAAATGLFLARKDLSGALVFRFACQIDGSDYALLDVDETLPEFVRVLYPDIEKTEISKLSVFTPTEITAIANGKIFTGDTLRKALSQAGKINTQSPFYSRF